MPTTSTSRSTDVGRLALLATGDERSDRKGAASSGPRIRRFRLVRQAGTMTTDPTHPPFAHLSRTYD